MRISDDNDINSQDGKFEMDVGDVNAVDVDVEDSNGILATEILTATETREATRSSVCPPLSRAD